MALYQIIVQPNERDREVAEDVVSSANIVTCDGYYEIDIDAVEIAIATYRAEIEAAARADERAKRDAEIKKLRQELTNEKYMREAYRQMLGPKGRTVARMWEEQGLVRQHTCWTRDPYSMNGEEVADIHLAFEAGPKQFVSDIDAITNGEIDRGE